MPELREPTPGDPIDAATIAELVRRARGEMGTSDGIGDAGPHANATKLKAGRRYYLVNAAHGDIQPYSLFGISLVGSSGTPVEVDAEPIGIDAFGSHCALLTNDEITIPSGKSGWARCVDYWDITKLRVTGTAPKTGWPCGPVLDTMGVGLGQYGFVMIGPTTEEDVVWVARTREPVGVLGRAYGSVPAFIEGSSSGVLGEGLVELMYRGPDGYLMPATDPETRVGPWRLPIWNAGETQLSSGQLLRAHDVMGVGLVADKPGGGGVLSMVRVEHDPGSTDFDLKAPNASDVHPGHLWERNGVTWEAGADIWIQFLDYWEVDAGDVIAEERKVYGPALRVGTLDVSGDERPLYACQSGEQTFVAKRSSATTKGSSVAFDLYHRATETDSTLDKTAQALGAAIGASKWATVSRLAGGEWYAGCWET